MAEMTSGTVELWGGWSLRLPNACMTERTPEGAWAAWDAAHTIDVEIVEVAGDASGRPMPAEKMLGQEETTTGEGWVGSVEQLTEPDDAGVAHRYALTAAATNTFLSCWVAYRDPAEVAWAVAVQQGLEHKAPS